MKSKGLGKGLGALLSEANVVEGTPQEIDIKLIDPNKLQARKSFSEEALRELADSIKEHGVVQPILVKPQGERYLIIAGERRWRAARLAGLKTIPAILKDLDERQLMEVSLIENLQRQDLNAAEEAEGIRMLMEEYHLTQEEAAKRIGKSRPYIANSLRLLNLCPEVLEKVRKGDLSAGHARCLVTLPREEQIRLSLLIIDKQLSVRQVEELLKAEERERDTEPRPTLPEIAEAEALLRELLGTKVKLTGSPKRGRILIEYYSMDELEGILERLK